MSMLLALLVAAAQPAASAAPPQLEFVAGRAVSGRWRMEAATLVRIDDLPPTIAGQRCTIAGPGLRLQYTTHGGTVFEIGGAAYGYRNADITGFEIGGIDYEARMRTEETGRLRYSDVDYPADFVDPRNGAPATVEGLVVRHRPEEPWLSHVSLVDDMIAVPGIGIRYRRGGRELRTRLSTTGFGDAIRWCQGIFESDRAHRLPARLRRIILR
jgi:hypothetical protein